MSSAWYLLSPPIAMRLYGAADEVAVFADGGEGGPVVAVGILLRPASGDGEDLGDIGRHLRRNVRSAVVEQRVTVELPVHLGVDEVDDRRQHVDRRCAVVASAALELSWSLDEQRHPEDLLPVGVGDQFPPDMRWSVVVAVV